MKDKIQLESDNAVLTHELAKALLECQRLRNLIQAMRDDQDEVSQWMVEQLEVSEDSDD